MGNFEPPEKVRRIQEGLEPDPYAPAPEPEEPDVSDRLPIGDTRPRQRFDAVEGGRLRDEGIARADAAAPSDWRQRALAAGRMLARTRREFTTDDLWAVLDGDKPREPRSLGAVMRSLQNEGLIESTEAHVKTERPEAHRNPKRVWQSNVYAGEAA